MDIREQGKDLGALVASRAVLVTVSIHRLGIRRDVKTASVLDVNVGADADMLTISKKLIDSKEYDAIVKLDGEFYRDMQHIVLPSRFRRGSYLLPVALLAKAEERIKLFLDMRGALVPDFLAVYEQRCQEARISLGPLYNERDYPTLDVVQQAFYIEVAYEAYSAPDILEALDAGLYAREQKRVQNAMEDMALEARQALRSGLLMVVQKLQEELTPRADGTPRKLYDSVLRNLTGFLDTLEARNITSDADLQAVGDKLRAVMAGVDRKGLKDKDLRQEIAASLTATSTVLAGMVQDVPRRKFSFEV